MSPDRLAELVSDIANALQSALGHSAAVRRDAQATTDEAVKLEAELARAVVAATRLREAR